MNDNQQDESINNLQLAIEELGKTILDEQAYRWNDVSKLEKRIEELALKNDDALNRLWYHEQDLNKRIEELESKNLDALNWIAKERDEILKNHAGRLEELERQVNLQSGSRVGVTGHHLLKDEKVTDKPQNSSDEMLHKNHRGLGICKDCENIGKLAGLKETLEKFEWCDRHNNSVEFMKKQIQALERELKL